MKMKNFFRLSFCFHSWEVSREVQICVMEKREQLAALLADAKLDFNVRSRIIFKIIEHYVIRHNSPSNYLHRHRPDIVSFA